MDTGHSQDAPRLQQLLQLAPAFGAAHLGVVVGVEGEISVPRTFVPWQNISYLAEGGGLESVEDNFKEIP